MSTTTTALLPAPVSAASMWQAVTGDPATGALVTSLNGDILFANSQLDWIFQNDRPAAQSAVGRNIVDFMPAAWVDARIRVHHRVLTTGRAVGLRSIWKGQQVFSWIQLLPTEIARDQRRAPLPSEAIFLSLSRRMPGDLRAHLPLQDEDLDSVETDRLDLSPLAVLSPRELEVLVLLGEGLSSKEIAARLFRSRRTVENHRLALGHKLRVKSRIELVQIAHRAGLTLRDIARIRGR